MKQWVCPVNFVLLKTVPGTSKFVEFNENNLYLELNVISSSFSWQNLDLFFISPVLFNTQYNCKQRFFLVMSLFLITAYRPILKDKLDFILKLANFLRNVPFLLYNYSKVRKTYQFYQLDWFFQMQSSLKSICSSRNLKLILTIWIIYHPID